MKIAIISPSTQHLQQVVEVLNSAGHQAEGYEGGKSRMTEIASREAPDLMLVDGMCRHLAELEQIERITGEHPKMAVMLLCASHTPEFLLNAMRAGVREVLPSPVNPTELHAAIARVAARMTAPLARPDGKVIAFMPCKGGCGATFLASNLGWQLAQTSSVLLIDLNLQFGDALSFLHDGNPPATLADVARDIGRLDASLLSSSSVKVSPSFSVLAAPSDLAQAMEVGAHQIDAILALASKHYDFVVLDMARQLDPLTIKALDRAWRIFPVMQSSVPDLRHATRLLQAFHSLGYTNDKLEVIINRFEKSAEISVDVVSRALRSVQVRTVANSYRDVSASINHGDPLGQIARGNPVARQLAELAQALSPPAEASRGFMDRLFRRA